MFKYILNLRLREMTNIGVILQGVAQKSFYQENNPEIILT